MEGVDVIVIFIILHQFEGVLRLLFCRAMQGYGAFVDLRENGELIEDLLRTIASQVGRHDLVERRVFSVLIELSIK